jgi:hypothetical protein
LSSSELARRAHWLIAKHANNQVEVLTIGPDDEALPVFSFEEEALMYLRLRAGTPETGWGTRQTTAGELASVLYGPCASVRKVALDPPPEACGGPLLGLLSVERDEFVRILLEGRCSAPRPIPSTLKF